MKYSISDITTLLADPYALHARRIMRLLPLNPLDAETDPQVFGNIVHDGLKAVAATPGWAQAPDAAARLQRSFEQELGKPRLRRALTAFWRVRLARIADWIVDIERARIDEQGAADAIAVELAGAWRFDRFIVHGRADRIEQRGNDLALIDYKTGLVPDDRDVASGAAPQLPLEAVIGEAGGFPGFAGNATELAYWKLSGGATEGATRAVFKSDADKLHAVIAAARTAIPALLAHYAAETTPFLDRPHPGRATYASDYAGVSRRAEWEDGA